MSRTTRRTEKVRRTVIRETTERTEEIREDFPLPLPAEGWVAVNGELDPAGEPIGEGMWIRRCRPGEVEEQRRVFALPHYAIVVDARDNYRFMEIYPNAGAAGAAACAYLHRLSRRVGHFAVGGWWASAELA